MNLDPDKKSHHFFAMLLAYGLIGLGMVINLLPERWQEWFVKQFDDVDSIWMD